MSATTSSDLARAKALLASPDNWLQFGLRRESPDGGRVQRCIMAAIADAIPLERGCDQWRRRLDEARAAYQAAVGADNVMNWNDKKGRTHAQVLGGFDKAIAEESEEP